MVGDCKIHQSYRDDIKSLKYPEFDFMPALFRGQGYPTLLRIFLRFGIIRYCVPNCYTYSYRPKSPRHVSHVRGRQGACVPV